MFIPMQKIKIHVLLHTLNSIGSRKRVQKYKSADKFSNVDLQSQSDFYGTNILLSVYGQSLHTNPLKAVEQHVDNLFLPIYSGGGRSSRKAIDC